MSYSLTLKMEAECSSETLQNFYQTIGRYMPEDGTQHWHRDEKTLGILCLKTSVRMRREAVTDEYVATSLFESRDSVLSMRRK
jgi:hypothetical protein